MLRIGNYMHASKVVVAPMAGVTDRPFRDLCRQFGAHWLVSEMLTSDVNLWESKKSSHRLVDESEPGPRWVQLAGNDPEAIAHAAAMNVAAGGEIIDINMGCPAKKVCKKAAGSALLRDEKLVSDILGAVVAAVDLPVTLKTRLGWSRDEINIDRIAKIAEDAGIDLLTIHGRSRACKFDGQATYDEIAGVVSRLNIPIIANGDITTPEQAEQVLQLTGADAVMIGRAAQGQPWLPAHIDHYLATGEHLQGPSREAVQRMLIQQVHALHGFYGSYTGTRVARKHIGWTLSWLGEEALRRSFNQAGDLDQQLATLAQLDLKAGLEIAA